jgi:hypothetical protein
MPQVLHLASEFRGTRALGNVYRWVLGRWARQGPFFATWLPPLRSRRASWRRKSAGLRLIAPENGSSPSFSRTSAARRSADQCRGDDVHVGAGLCIGIGGVRIDRAVALQILEAVSHRAVEAAIFASDQIERSRKDIITAVAMSPASWRRAGTPHWSV